MEKEHAFVNEEVHDFTIPTVEVASSGNRSVMMPVIDVQKSNYSGKDPLLLEPKEERCSGANVESVQSIVDDISELVAAKATTDAYIHSAVNDKPSMNVEYIPKIGIGERYECKFCYKKYITKFSYDRHIAKHGMSKCAHYQAFPRIRNLISDF